MYPLRRLAARSIAHAAALLFIIVSSSGASAQDARPRFRDLGATVGVFTPGKENAITDVEGVRVGHVTLKEGQHIRTGVTAIMPHAGNLFREKVPAAIVVGNGIGKLVGSTQVDELGVLETPIVLTNTLSVWDAAKAVARYMTSLPGNEEVRSVNPIVGETNDGYLNDIRGMHVTEEHVLAALRGARSGLVEEGAVGAGTGTVCFGWKGGIGTSSRLLPLDLGGWTLGVLVQTNFGGILDMAGVPVGKELGSYSFRGSVERSGGSCMIVVATNAPLDARQLKRLALRSLLGLGRTGSFMGHGSGDYVIAFSTSANVRLTGAAMDTVPRFGDENLNALFQSAVESVEEAVYNSLLKAESTAGARGNKVEALPVERVKAILRKYCRLSE
ncbi:MAG: aminopeptidase [Ignavibacteria bacterium RIFCSPLOWO2_12_FULL_56_21]|nr:MAG: aminopeptidase [Ignavibacteria bacterium RIFCSPLOWO2_12_FULL_56_21]